jgi:hypothetical protein
VRSLWGYIEHILAALRGRDGLKANGQPLSPGEAGPASPPEVSAPAEAFEVSVPAEAFEVSVPAEAFQVSLPAEAFQVSLPAEAFEVSVPAEAFQVSLPAEAFEASVPAEAFEASVPAEASEVSVPAEASEVSAPAKASRTLARRGGSRPARARGRYKALVRFHLTEYRVKVRRWRRSMSGIAYELRSGDGSVKRMIEAPLPRGPMSAAVFLHEIGHHAIGFNRYKPRCLEEYHAWAWALAAMERHGVSVTDRVRQCVHASLHYAIAKAIRRGLKVLPTELRPYTIWPPPVRSSRRAARGVSGRA